MSTSIGKARDTFGMEAVNVPKSMSPMARPSRSRYQVVQVSTGRSWSLKMGVNKVGRGLDNDIILTDTSVSRKHARIRVDHDAVYIDDLDSANGTIIGGDKVVHATLLPNMDFKLGKVDLVIRQTSVFENASARWAAGGNWVDTWD